MRILIASTYGTYGGAGKAASRLHEGLLSAGIDSHFISLYHTGSAPRTHTAAQTLPGWVRQLDLPARADRLQVQHARKIPPGAPFSAGVWAWPGWKRVLNTIKPDIIHLHWINNGLMSPAQMARLGVPLVWSLHDMWPLTGGCHYTGGCNRYQDTCGRCPVLGSEVDHDLSKRLLEKKCRHLSRVPRMTVVGLSQWLATCAQESRTFAGRAVVHIPNPLDVDRFCPQDQREARRAWGLPMEKPLILFGAVNSMADSRKGFDLLQAALAHLARDPDFDAELVVFGATAPNPSAAPLPLPAHYVGNITEESRLISLYAAADVMLVPSRQENLANTLAEALACGTPAVGFRIGGNADLITHLSNGYLAHPFDTQDLAGGIRWAISAPGRENRRQAARMTAEAKLDDKKVIPQYVALYQHMLEATQASPAIS